MNIRYTLFGLLDRLKGSPVRKHLEDITQRMQQPYSGDDYLANVLAHAVRTVPFYHYLTENAQLPDFPVIDKNIIRENFAAFKSTQFDENQLFKVVTSGSTGTPFSIFQDKGKKIRNTADTIWFAEQTGFKIGYQLYYFKIWNHVNRKTKLLEWMQNIVAQDVTNLSDRHIEKLLHELKNNRIKGFLGYASAYEAICRYMEQQKHPRLDCNLRSAIAMSEGLNDYTRGAMERYFKVRVVSRYSNVENGIIAQQFPGEGTSFYLNTASYKVEILDIDRDTPVNLGEIGRIVVTDYFNIGMPMIRYDTGDLGKLTESNGQLVLQSVEGRRMDAVYNTQGDLVSSFTITNNMWKYPEIRQYQFVQQDATRYRFLLNAEGVFQRETELVTEFKSYFGQDAQFSVNYVHEIPLLSSGKRKKVVNEFKK